MAAAKRTKKAAAPVETIEEVDLDLDEGVEEVEEAPAKAKKAPAEKIEFGSAWLASHVNEETGSSYDAYNLRILLRKLTKDGVLTREESAGRARYSFTGPEDPQVVAIVAAVKDGAAEKAKQERLDGLKEQRKTKKAAAPKKSKKAPVEVEEVEEEDDFDVEEI